MPTNKISDTVTKIRDNMAICAGEAFLRSINARVSCSGDGYVVIATGDASYHVDLFDGIVTARI